MIMIKKLPLTKKKLIWAKKRDVTLMGHKLTHNAALEQRYAIALRKLVLEMTLTSKKMIIKLFNQPFAKEFVSTQEKMAAMDDSLGSQARILLNYLSKKFEDLFADKSKKMAESMLDGVDKTSKTNLHNSLKQLSGGLSLKTGIVPKGFDDIANATIAENVNLIKSIPQEYFKQVTGSVMRSITEGRGIRDLIPEIEKYDGQTYRRAKNIALDQTRKAYNTINKQRLTALGVKQFEWLHSGGGQTPRESHLKIDGHIFSFENLEAEQAALGVPKNDRGLPSIPTFCRCTIRPVIDLSE